MSKLEELIQELCPDGVEYKKLKEIVEYQRGKSITKKAVIEGDIPVISGGQQPAYYHNESNREGKTITIAGSGAYAGYIMYWEKPIFVSDAFSLKGNEISINTKYIYYYLKKIQEKIYSLRKGAGISHVYFKDMQDFLVPVPPLEVQCEIVRILDKFTLLTAELTAELTARRKQYEYYRKHLLETNPDIIKKMEELLLRTEGDEVELIKMREKQYEYYRNKLFKTLEQNKLNNNSSKDDEINEIDLEKVVQELYSNGIEYKKLGEICNISRGRVMSKDYIKNNIGQFPVYSSQTENNGELGKIATYDFDGEYLTWTTDGANAGSVFYRNGKFSITNVCGLIKVNNELVNTKYLYYALTIETHKYVNSGMGNPKLMSNVMVEVKVPVPPLEVQNKIVDVLDRFDKLCNGISDGLPAEIEARQKQYEYYRDLLLNFKKGDVDE